MQPTNLKYTTFKGENGFVNTTEEAKALLSEGNKIVFVNVKNVKGLQNNAFHTYKEAQIFADSLTAQYPANTIYINIQSTEVAEAEEIDF